MTEPPPMDPLCPVCGIVLTASVPVREFVAIEEREALGGVLGPVERREWICLDCSHWAWRTATGDTAPGDLVSPRPPGKYDRGAWWKRLFGPATTPHECYAD